MTTTASGTAHPFRREEITSPQQLQLARLTDDGDKPAGPWWWTCDVCFQRLADREVPTIERRALLHLHRHTAEAA